MEKIVKSDLENLKISHSKKSVTAEKLKSKLSEKI